MLFVAAGMGVLLVLGASIRAAVRSEEDERSEPCSLVHQQQSTYQCHHSNDIEAAATEEADIMIDRYELAWARAADRHQRMDIEL